MTNRKSLSISIAIAFFSAVSGCLALISDPEPPRPPVFSLQSIEEPEKFHIFFSAMGYLKSIGVNKALFFLTRDEEEIYERFSLDNATCIANSSYCFITRGLPQPKPGQCEWLVTVRGNMIRDSEVCDFEACPNMETPVKCHLTIVEPIYCKTPSSVTCPSLPSELEVFRSRPGATALSSTSPDASGSSNSAVLAVLVSLAVACMGLIIVTCLAIYRWLNSPRYVVFVSLTDQFSHADDPLTKAKSPYYRPPNLPKFPSKSDAEFVALMPDYSLAATQPLKNFVRDSGV